MLLVHKATIVIAGLALVCPTGSVANEGVKDQKPAQEEINHEKITSADPNPPKCSLSGPPEIYSRGLHPRCVSPKSEAATRLDRRFDRTFSPAGR